MNLPPLSHFYTSDEKRTRIALYVGVGAIGSLVSSISDLAAMTDDQLHAMSVVRWTIKILLLVLGAALAAGNAFRAAIDRSTAGGSEATTTTPTTSTTNP